MNARHHHGYICTQLRHESWWTRRCMNPGCGAVVLTWQARAAIAVALVCIALLIGALA